jgi:hypothetical protein
MHRPNAVRAGSHIDDCLLALVRVSPLRLIVNDSRLEIDLRLDAALLGRATTVVGQWCNIGNRCYSQATSLERAN